MTTRLEISDRTWDRFDVVIVPFPFTDRHSSKRRPALVLSSDTELQSRIGHSVLAMITSQETPPWPHDVPLSDLESAGLSRDSKIRMKLFTLDDRLILRKQGSLSEKDRRAVEHAIRKVLGIREKTG